MGHLWTRLFRHKDVRILLLGLDAAGKTTILYRLKLEELVTTIPTIGFNVETIQYRDINFTAWDIGSRDKIRPLFRHYYRGTDAVVFVIDSSDRERLDELNYDVIKPAVTSEELANAVFLFLANKQDLNGVMTVEEISDKLGLKSLKHTWNLLPVSAVRGDGLYAALDWLASKMGSNQSRRGAASSSSSTTPAPPPEPLTPRQDEAQSRRRTEGEAEGEGDGEGLNTGMDYCSRAYCAIKCLFFRTNRQDSSDSS